MSHKSVAPEFSTECSTRVSTRVPHKSVSYKRSHKSRVSPPTKVSRKGVPQELPTKVAHKSALQELSTRAGVPQQCRTSVPQQLSTRDCFLQECSTIRVSHKSAACKSALQESPTRVSNNVWPFVFECAHWVCGFHLVLILAVLWKCLMFGNRRYDVARIAPATRFMGQ